jgi:uncharacterized protein (TIGR02284 family)
VPSGREQVENKKQTREHRFACEYVYMSKQDTIIDNLIETLKDGQEGFKQAAQSVKDPQLKSVFDEYSRQRARFVSELRSQAQSPEERESKPSGSAAGALHRGWMNLKSALTRADDHAILAECERGEDSAVEEYKKALDNGLSAPVQQILSRQYAQIKEAHDRVKSLRDTTK